MFKDKKVIIFDMDGTLIDSVGIWNEVDFKLIKKLGHIRDIEREQIQLNRDKCLRLYNNVENPYVKYCEYLGKLYGFKLSGEEILNERYLIAKEYLINEIDYKENADIFIKMLKKDGYIIGIASTTRKDNMTIYKTENKNIIKKANLNEYFSFIYTREDAKEIKPNPEIYNRIVKEQNVTPEECMIFEDSLIGVEAAKNANIECVAIYDKYSDNEREKINKLSDFQFKNYTEVIRKFEEEL